MKGNDSQTSTNWMKALTKRKTNKRCPKCKAKVNAIYQFQDPPSFITLMIERSLSVEMQHIMSVSGYEYKLYGLIYHGDHHFSCRVVDKSGGIWFHDGIHTKKNCEYEGNISQVDPNMLMKARHGRICILGIYVLVA